MKVPTKRFLCSNRCLLCYHRFRQWSDDGQEMPERRVKKVTHCPMCRHPGDITPVSHLSPVPHHITLLYFSKYLFYYTVYNGYIYTHCIIKCILLYNQCSHVLKWWMLLLKHILAVIRTKYVGWCVALWFRSLDLLEGLRFKCCNWKNDFTTVPLSNTLNTNRSREWRWYLVWQPLWFQHFWFWLLDFALSLVYHFG